MQEILQARLPPRVVPDGESIQRAMKTYSVNEPQAAAILGAMQTEQFSLIQGVRVLRCNEIYMILTKWIASGNW
jgi:hypothetical protein